MAKPRTHSTVSARQRAALFQMVVGKWLSQAIATVADMGVPDRVAKGARRCSDLSREAGVSEDGLYRLLRALASVGLFAETSGRRFTLTPAGQLLRSDHPESLAGFARFVGHDCTWRPWGRLDYSVKTGLPAFDHVFGESIFGYFEKNADAAAVFDEVDPIAFLQSRYFGMRAFGKSTGRDWSPRWRRES